MSVKLFVDLGSQPSRAVHWACLLLKIPFELHALRLDKGQSKTPEYLANVHPFGKVPAIQHRDLTLIESNAILAYLCAQFDIAGSLYPKQPVDRARIDSYLHWHHEFRAGCAGYFVQAVWKNKDTSEAEKQLHSVLKKFESYWLGKYQFIQSNTFTIADMQAANEIYQVTPFYPALLDSYPNTKSWLDRVKKVPGHDEMLKGWLKLVPLLQSKRASKL